MSELPDLDLTTKKSIDVVVLRGDLDTYLNDCIQAMEFLVNVPGITSSNDDWLVELSKYDYAWNLGVSLNLPSMHPIPSMLGIVGRNTFVGNTLADKINGVFNTKNSWLFESSGDDSLPVDTTEVDEDTEGDRLQKFFFGEK